MIINPIIIAYLLLSCLSIFTGIIACSGGIPAWKKWDITSNGEEQYNLEKKIYFVITILSLGFIFRFLMTPLWFMSLKSMIPSMPGAMCLAGVHEVNNISYAASTMKIVLPIFYAYWLTLNFLDRKIITQPYLKQKIRLLFPLGLIIIVESILDISFLASVFPRKVSCCTSVYNASVKSHQTCVFCMLDGHPWYLLFSFLIVAGLWLLIIRRMSRLSRKLQYDEGFP